MLFAQHQGRCFVSLVEQSVAASEASFLQTFGTLGSELEERVIELIDRLYRAVEQKSFRHWGCSTREEFRQRVQIPKEEFDELLRLGKTYLHKLQWTAPQLRRLGLRRARLLRMSTERLDRRHGSAAANRFLHLAMQRTCCELESKYEIDSLLSEALAPPPVSTSTLTAPATAEPPCPAAELALVRSTLLRQIAIGKNRFPQPPADFIISPQAWLQLTFAVQTASHLLMIGPAGSGKTELAAQLAQATGRRLQSFSFGAMSDPRTSLIGTTHFSPETGTVFFSSRFANAIQQPRTIILLDELNRTDRETFNMLMPLLDGQKYLAMDEARNSPIIRVAEDLCFLGTMNVGPQYTATSALDAAIRDRFHSVLRIHYPPPAEEALLLRKRHPGIAPKDAEILVKIAGKQRSLARDGEFEFAISTRMLLATCLQLEYGIRLAEAIEFTLTSHFSDEGGLASDQTRFRQLLQQFITS